MVWHCNWTCDITVILQKDNFVVKNGNESYEKEYLWKKARFANDNIITREMIDYEFMDVLSKKERDAMFDRINGVKNVIMHQKEAEAEARNAKRKFRSKFTKNHQWDTYLKNLEGLVENDRKAKKPFVWGCYSYLDEDCFK